MKKPIQYLSTQDAAAVLKVSSARVRQLSDDGTLVADGVTKGGISVYLPATVEKLRRDRGGSATDRAAAHKRAEKRGAKVRKIRAVLGKKGGTTPKRKRKPSQKLSKKTRAAIAGRLNSIAGVRVVL